MSHVASCRSQYPQLLSGRLIILCNHSLVCLTLHGVLGKFMLYRRQHLLFQ